MSNVNAPAKVDVLAVMDAEVATIRRLESWVNEAMAPTKLTADDAITRMTDARAAVAELIEADRWRDPITEPAEHRQRVLVAYEMGRHVVVGAAVRWLHTPGDHDGKDAWELADSSYIVKVLAWKPMPGFDRAALARVGGAS